MLACEQDLISSGTKLLLTRFSRELASLTDSLLSRTRLSWLRLRWWRRQRPKACLQDNKRLLKIDNISLHT